MRSIWLLSTSRLARFALLLGMGLAATLASAPASAYILCDPSTLCSTTVTMDGQSTRSLLSSLENTVAEAVRQADRDIVNAIGNQTSAISGISSKNAQTIGDQNAALQQAAQNAAVVANITTPSCGAAAASQGPASGGARTVTYAGGVNYTPGNVDQRWTKALAESESSAKAVPPPKEADFKRADNAVGGCKTFSDPSSIRGMYCSYINAPSSNMNPYKDADIKAATLMNGPTLPNAKIKDLSVPPTGQARDARQAYLTMLNNASPPSAPDEEALNTPLGASYLGLYSEYRAAKSMATYPSEEYDRLSTVDPSTQTELSTIAQQDSAFLSRYESGMDPTSYQNGVSPITMMDIEVERRIGNPDWMTRMAAADDKAKQAEMLMIAAYDMRIKRDQLVATWQTNVLLGKLLNMKVEDSFRPRLDKFNAALRSSRTQAVATPAPTSGGSQ